MKKTILTVLLSITAFSLVGCYESKPAPKTVHSGIKAGEYIKESVDLSKVELKGSPSAGLAGEHIKNNVNIEELKEKPSPIATKAGEHIKEVVSGLDNGQSSANLAGEHIKNNVITDKAQKKIEKSKAELNSMISGSTYIQYGDNIDNATFIFFDPQCIHCHNLFVNSQNGDFENETFVWIPLAYLNENSLLQSITILSSENPKETLKKHEDLYKENGFGLEPIKVFNQEIKDQVLENNKVFKNTKFGGVPVLLKVGKDGSINVEKGGLPSDLLKEFVSK